MLSNNFRILGSPTLRIDTPQFGLIDFRELSDENALEIWEKGFKHLGISNEGAKKYLSKLNSSEIVELIKTRTDIDDVLILAQLKKTKAVKAAKEFMLEKLAD
jgi:hypothetical protein